MSSSSKDKVNVLIYTPTYVKSKGLQYRLMMLTRTLAEHGYNVKLYKDEYESVFRTLYNYVAWALLQFKATWIYLGDRISRRILKINPPPDMVFLTTDVCSGAIRILKSHGIRVILLLEDLSVDWLNVHGSARKRILNHMFPFVSEADAIITPSESFSKSVSAELGLDTVPVPPGLEVKITEEEAISRVKEDSLLKPRILHARQLATKREADLLTTIATKLGKHAEIYALKAGRYCNRVNIKDNIIWYRYQSVEEAIEQIKICHIGLIASHRSAPTFTSQWFYFSLLQPVITITNNYVDDTLWIPLEDFSSTPQKLQEEIINVMSMYEWYVRRLMQRINLKYKRQEAHKPLLKVLREL